MEKYNKLLRNITELIEKGLFNSKDLKMKWKCYIKFKIEDIANKLNLFLEKSLMCKKKLLKNLKRFV